MLLGNSGVPADHHLCEWDACSLDLAHYIDMHGQARWYSAYMAHSICISMLQLADITIHCCMAVVIRSSLELRSLTCTKAGNMVLKRGLPHLQMCRMQIFN